jgi:hypothetical protein
MCSTAARASDGRRGCRAKAWAATSQSRSQQLERCPQASLAGDVGAPRWRSGMCSKPICCGPRTVAGVCSHLTRCAPCRAQPVITGQALEQVRGSPNLNERQRKLSSSLIPRRPLIHGSAATSAVADNSTIAGTPLAELRGLSLQYVHRALSLTRHSLANSTYTYMTTYVVN